jgi:hypothetical protein
MVTANNGTTVEKIRQTATHNVYEAKNVEQGFVRYIYYPRSMDLTEKEAAESEFEHLEFN